MRKILLTGSSGFLGKSIQSVLHSNFELITLGRSKSDILCDISKEIPSLPYADLVIHSAGKAHIVPKTEAEKQAFYDVNVKGTENLLRGLELSSSLPKSFVFISSVAVYGQDKGTLIKEEHTLKAKDPYGQSKIEAEQIVQEWCEQNNVICAILRLPLLVGANPPGNLGAMIKGLQKGYYMNIAGGYAKKSMVLAEDVAEIIPKAAEIGGVYNLTDGYHPSFRELSAHIAECLNKKVAYNIPAWVAKMLAKTGDIIGSKSPFNSYKLSKITADLTFDDSKARMQLGWNPRKVLDVDFLT
ncbi:NAD-dependent epimerase/dehydratase [Pseudopedobacter saltans DSM 12145]|uniref:NAD-dependent epimerase/dehydratase n=1 Tax=Pseudopedobacter saltans (strain ATCC 51119 / DSM 12145 / JCM 21818 / CCUG 39354 / LMG 10337 / NBRC 100064 / NCIMB 13643) TaxID=762903 RepID=F0SBT7_PSESL|nr:NAD-dependent epimerase/dehydratase family protein [Pseudopedobacter saltans]ADY53778.1 NAD-dependent epimerase/dehydratase [Pseudopedobacter saltans DSM 12145]